ncbi:uncharacterized protein P884DRAFT_289784 [Thermothelomyces heterothallicus CBS 202.75]|uniref:uncharacterized protein n=1 Tax=Thermothelomyces heterothallicus CBS 202.75 TaxID=1149848 RepID=UPI003742E1B4
MPQDFSNALEEAWMVPSPLRRFIVVCPITTRKTKNQDHKRRPCSVSCANWLESLSRVCDRNFLGNPSGLRILRFIRKRSISCKNYMASRAVPKHKADIAQKAALNPVTDDDEPDHEVDGSGTSQDDGEPDVFMPPEWSVPWSDELLAQRIREREQEVVRGMGGGLEEW